MCKLPYGISDYKLIRNENYVYIDKSQYIELLEKDKRYLHFLRPRRFGKTLFTSMLGYYYDFAMESQFDNLFGPCSPLVKGTYIYEHPTESRNSYFVLNFNFSGLSEKKGKELEEAFNFKVYKTLENFCTKYELNITLPSHMSASQTLFSFLKDFEVHNETKYKIYLMVDEYDHFANDLLSFSSDEFKKATNSDGFIRSFFEEIKVGTETVIDRVFITGVSPITLDSLTSGYNISTNLSLDPRYNEMMGFTTEEMKHLISIVDNIQNEQETLAELKQHYDGYRFSDEYEHHVYNPNMSLYYLDHVQNIGKPPKELTDPNILSDYKKIENLLKIEPKKIQQQQEVLEDILAERTIRCRITPQFNLHTDFTKADFISLLYYLGYLTIADYKRNQATLKVPNDVIRIVYFDYFNAMLQKHYHISTDDYAEAMYEILDEKKNTLFVSKIEEVLHSLDNRDFIKFREEDVKVAAMAIAGSNSFILTKSEYAVPEGYIDLVLFPYQTDGATALIELKYIKKEECTEEAVHKKREEAYAQLQKYKNAKEFQNIDVVKWIMIFSKDKCVLNEVVE